jgi:hypothetical protein
MRRRFLQTVFERTFVEQEEVPAIAAELKKAHFEIQTARQLVRLSIAARTEYYIAREEGRAPASIDIEASRLPTGLRTALRQKGVKTFGDLVTQGGTDVKIPAMTDELKPFLWGYLAGLALIEVAGIPVAVTRRDPPRIRSSTPSPYGFARNEGQQTEPRAAVPSQESAAVSTNNRRLIANLAGPLRTSAEKVERLFYLVGQELVIRGGVGIDIGWWGKLSAGSGNGDLVIRLGTYSILEKNDIRSAEAALCERVLRKLQFSNITTIFRNDRRPVMIWAHKAAA